MVPGHYGDESAANVPGQDAAVSSRLPSGRVVTADDVEIIRGMLRAVTASDRQFGGRNARVYATGYLHTVVWPLLNAGADDGISHELIVVATEFVLRVASLQLDAGYTQASRKLLGVA